MGTEQVFPRSIRVARRLTQQLALAPPVDVVMAINAVGLAIIEVDTPLGLDGFLAYHAGVDEFGIFVSRARDPSEQRLILAHELGHYLLHEDILRESRQIICPYVPWMEQDASAFAYELLIPEAEAHRTYRLWSARKLNGFECQICPERVFGVTRLAWCWRIRQLGYKHKPCLPVRGMQGAKGLREGKR